LAASDGQAPAGACPASGGATGASTIAIASASSSLARPARHCCHPKAAAPTASAPSTSAAATAHFPARAAAITRFALNLIPFYAGLSGPFIPDAADRMAAAMGAAAAWPGSVEQALRRLPEGHSFAAPEVLFAKIADEDRANWQARFAGRRG